MITRAGGNSCKVERFLTNKGLIPFDCTTTTEVNLFSTLTFTAGTDTTDHLGFTSITYDENRKFDKTVPLMMRAFGMSLTQIDDRVIEMLLIEPFVEADVKNSIIKFYRNMNDAITASYTHNRDPKPIDPLKHVTRMIKDNLPGYFLGSAQEADPKEDEGTFQYVEDWGSSQKAKSIHILMYFSNPEQFVDNQLHQLTVLSDGFRVNSIESNTLLFIYMTILIKRKTDNLEIQVWNEMGHSILSGTVTGVDFSKYLYMGFTIGQGILFYISDTLAFSRLELTASFYQSGGLKQYMHKSIPKPPGPLNQLFKTDDLTDPTGQCTRRWTSVKYFNPQGNDYNKIGVRVFQLVYGIGAYPFHLIAENPLAAIYERCFWQGFNNNKCLGMALLLDSSEAQVTVLHDSSSHASEVSNPMMLTGCRVPLTQLDCVIPKDGYIVNLDPDQTSPIYRNLISETDYSNLKQEHKDFFVEYLVDPGNPDSQKFLLSCPYECKICF